MKNALIGAGRDEGIVVGELVVTGGVEESRLKVGGRWMGNPDW